jgi:von Willebrand factor type D domain
VAQGDNGRISVGGQVTTASGNNYLPELSTNWTAAEFNVFGLCCNQQVTFNSGSTVTVQTQVTSPTPAVPITCNLISYTGESNNLTLVNSPPLTPTPPGAASWLQFSENSSAPMGAASCKNGISIGETHLATFNGLLYDFQATGDFLLAETGPEFSVQTRQVSATPKGFPNAAYNSAVAVQAGKNRVAICSRNVDRPVAVDGKPVAIADGGRLGLSGGGTVIRKANVYYVLAPSGDSVTATVWPGPWIDLSVGLGRWPSKVRGLLANTNGKVNEVETSEGQVLTIPLSFNTLYGHFTDSWRVASSQSMLSACGASDLRGIPQKPFFANDLGVELAKRSRTICTQAGVKEGPLLDACMIDVAVLGQGAAKVYAAVPTPIAVGDAR